MFGDQAMTLAAIGRLVHHATIFEMNVESYRRRAALDRKRGAGRPPMGIDIKTVTADDGYAAKAPALSNGAGSMR